MTLACTLSGQAQSTKRIEPTVPEKTADLIVPVLDLVYESDQECRQGKGDPCAQGPGFDHERARWVKVERLLARLMKNRSPAADEGVVVLLDYYVEENNEILYNVTLRGRKVLPYLLKYKNHRTQIPGRNYPDSMRAPRDVRDYDFADAIDAVKKGKVLE